MTVAQQFIDHGAFWDYEVRKYEYFVKSRNPLFCENCGYIKGLILKEYLPDFFLSNGVCIEVKGRLVPADKAKLIAVKKYHPDLDLRILFGYDRIISKDKGTRYSDWATSAGIPWAIKEVPEDWMLHADVGFPKNWKRTATLFPKGKVDLT